MIHLLIVKLHPVLSHACFQHFSEILLLKNPVPVVNMKQKLDFGIIVVPGKLLNCFYEFCEGYCPTFVIVEDVEDSFNKELVSRGHNVFEFVEVNLLLILAKMFTEHFLQPALATTFIFSSIF